MTKEKPQVKPEDQLKPLEDAELIALLEEQAELNAKNKSLQPNLDITRLRKEHYLFKLFKEAQDYANDKNYNRQELLNELLEQAKDNQLICGSLIKKGGIICMNKPHIREDGKTNGRCLRHGGNSSGPTHVNNTVLKRLPDEAKKVFEVTHDRFEFTKEEANLYIYTMNYYIEEYQLDMVNIIILDRAMRNYFLNARLEIARAGKAIAESKSIQDFDTKSLRFFQALGLDRKFVQSQKAAEAAKKIDLATIFMLPPSKTNEDSRKDVTIDMEQDKLQGGG